MLGIVLSIVLFVSIIAAAGWWLGIVGAPSDFFVGVEFAYNEDAGDTDVLVNDLKILVDKVKDYTNLFVVGSIAISFNQTSIPASSFFTPRGQRRSTSTRVPS